MKWVVQIEKTFIMDNENEGGPTNDEIAECIKNFDHPLDLHDFKIRICEPEEDYRERI